MTPTLSEIVVVVLVASGWSLMCWGFGYAHCWFKMLRAAHRDLALDADERASR